MNIEILVLSSRKVASRSTTWLLYLSVLNLKVTAIMVLVATVVATGIIFMVKSTSDVCMKPLDTMCNLIFLIYLVLSSF